MRKVGIGGWKGRYPALVFFVAIHNVTPNTYSLFWGFVNWERSSCMQWCPRCWKRAEGNNLSSLPRWILLISLCWSLRERFLVFFPSSLAGRIWVCIIQAIGNREISGVWRDLPRSSDALREIWPPTTNQKSAIKWSVRVPYYKLIRAKGQDMDRESTTSDTYDYTATRVLHTSKVLPLVYFFILWSVQHNEPYPLRSRSLVVLEKVHAVIS